MSDDAGVIAPYPIPITRAPVITKNGVLNVNNRVPKKLKSKQTWLKKKPFLFFKNTPEKKAEKTEEKYISEVTIPTEAALTPISYCAITAITGGVKTINEAWTWTKKVTVKHKKKCLFKFILWLAKLTKIIF